MLVIQPRLQTKLVTTSLATVTPAHLLVGTPFMPPPGIPTPHEFRSEIEVLDYVLALLDPPVIPVEAYARWARLSDIRRMMADPNSTPYVHVGPTSEERPSYSTPEPSDMAWIVGIRSMGVTSGDTIMGLTQMAGGSGTYRGGHEFYCLMDEIGNVREVGTLDAVQADGSVKHLALWMLSSIADLPRP